MTPESGGAAPGAGDADPGPLLAPVAAAAALGRESALAAALDAALGAGCPTAALREALLMLAPFGGFPRTLDALAALAAALGRAGRSPPPTATPAPRAAHAARGRELFDRVYGAGADRVMERLLGLDPELPGWVLEDAYGRVLARPGLGTDQRERLAVVLLAALGLRNQLSGHVRGALRCGATPEGIEASLRAAEQLLPASEVAAARAVLSRITLSGEEQQDDQEQPPGGERDQGDDGERDR